MFALEVLTLFFFVSVSRALVISISSSVTIDQPTPLTWARTTGEHSSFYLYLKGDITQDFKFLDKVVDNALNGTTDVTVSGFQPTTYYIVASFTNDLKDSFSIKVDASTDPFSLSAAQQSTTTTVSTSSSASSSELITTRTVITTNNGEATTLTSTIMLNSTTGSLSSTSSGSSNKTTADRDSSTTDLANSSGTKSRNGGTSTSEYTTNTHTTVLQPSSSSRTSSLPQNNSTSRTPIIVGSVIGAIVGISLLILLIFLIRWYQKRRERRAVVFYRDRMVRTPADTFRSEDYDEGRGNYEDSVMAGSEEKQGFRHWHSSSVDDKPVEGKSLIVEAM